MEISSNLPMSSNIPDSRRSVLSVCVSPLANLAAAVDCFGRVLLLDCQTLIVRRMWKGSQSRGSFILGGGGDSDVLLHL